VFRVGFAPISSSAGSGAYSSHPIELVTLWAMFTHAFRSLSYSIPHLGHLKILLLNLGNIPSSVACLRSIFVSFFVRYLTSIPSRSAL
jgi:hypothetical protein